MSSTAGLNAYIPVLVLGLLARYTSWVELAQSFTWLQHPFFLLTITILLVIELTVDKFPLTDHINDVIQTLIRPLSGGIVGGSVASTTLSASPSAGKTVTAHGSAEVIFAIIVGVIVAFVVHSLKATSRPGINVTTAGMGAPVVSTIGDVSSAGLSLLGIFFPICALIVLCVVAAVLVYAFFAFWHLRHAKYRRDIFYDV